MELANFSTFWLQIGCKTQPFLLSVASTSTFKVVFFVQELKKTSQPKVLI
jgi:hypothetical protein